MTFVSRQKSGRPGRVTESVSFYSVGVGGATLLFLSVAGVRLVGEAIH